jgi:hypothetical protein
MLLLKVYAAALFAAALASIYIWLDYLRLNPADYAQDELRRSDVVHGLAALIQLALYIFVGVTFLRWIYRANQNLRAISGRTMEFTPGWAVGWYFVPLANLFRPYQAMKEIWAVAHREPSYGNALLRGWWTLWLISNFLGQIAFRVALNTDDAATNAFSAAIDLAAAVFDILLTIVAILLVTRIGNACATNYPDQQPPAVPPPLPTTA